MRVTRFAPARRLLQRGDGDVASAAQNVGAACKSQTILKPAALTVSLDACAATMPRLDSPEFLSIEGGFAWVAFPEK
jgi:hypothetical protein